MDTPHKHSIIARDGVIELNGQLYLQQQDRATPEQIGRLLLTRPDGSSVRLADVADIRRTGENARRLPGVKLAGSVEPSADLQRLAEARIILAATPAQALRATARAAARFTRDGADWLICAKGVERGTHAFLSDIVAAELPGAVASILSGPSFAEDIAAGLPTAITLASPDAERAERLGRLLDSPTFRLYRSTDVRGAEIGGAAKNVLAIACGIAAGRKLGASAVAALTARGFAELSRFGRAFGAQPETLMGLSGLGDLILTCGSPQSRNFAYGLAIGRGEALDGLPLAEGVATAAVAARIARESGIDAPIIDAVHAILEQSVTIGEAVASLLSRPLKSEFE